MKQMKKLKPFIGPVVVLTFCLLCGVAAVRTQFVPNTVIAPADITYYYDISVVTNSYVTNLFSVSSKVQTLTVTNITIMGSSGATLTGGATNYIDFNKASETNKVTGALSFAYATNGVHGQELSSIRYLINDSGSDQNITFPSGWRTNVYSPMPTKSSNLTVTVVYCKAYGPTSSAALQTNVLVSFEYFK